MARERPLRLKIPSPDARVARSPFRSRTGTGLVFWDELTRQATGAFTITFGPINNATFVVAGRTYTYQSVLTDVDGHVLIGVDADDTIVNTINAVVLGPGAGVRYAASTTPNTDVVAVPGSVPNQALFVAIVRGLAGNAITTTDGVATGFALPTLGGGMEGVIAFVPIVQWGSIRIRAKITGSIGQLLAQFVRPGRNVAPLGEPTIQDPNADDEAFHYGLDQPAFNPVVLLDGTEVSLEIPATEHIGENWLKLTVSTLDPPGTVLDFCDVSGVLLDTHH